jgi:hypothetical protein
VPCCGKLSIFKFVGFVQQLQGTLWLKSRSLYSCHPSIVYLPTFRAILKKREPSYTCTEHQDSAKARPTDLESTVVWASARCGRNAKFSMMLPDFLGGILLALMRVQPKGARIYEHFLTAYSKYTGRSRS